MRAVHGASGSVGWLEGLLLAWVLLSNRSEQRTWQVERRAAAWSLATRRPEGRFVTPEPLEIGPTEVPATLKSLRLRVAGGWTGEASRGQRGERVRTRWGMLRGRR